MLNFETYFPAPLFFNFMHTLHKKKEFTRVDCPPCYVPATALQPWTECPTFMQVTHLGQILTLSVTTSGSEPNHSRLKQSRILFLCFFFLESLILYSRRRLLLTSLPSWEKLLKPLLPFDSINSGEWANSFVQCRSDAFPFEFRQLEYVELLAIALLKSLNIYSSNFNFLKPWNSSF